MAKKITFSCGAKAGYPKPILPARVANQNTEFAFSRPLADSAI